MTPHVSPAVPCPDDVRAELARILASSEFAASRHLTNFLQFVVEEGLAGRENHLKERTIALGALGRDPDFDSRLDCIVRVVAGKLRRALERYYATLGSTNPLCITVPRGTYVPVIRQAAAPLPLERTASVVPATGAANIPRNGVGLPTVAVIPFEALAGHKRDVVADMLTEDIAVRLSQLRWMEVLDCRATRSSGIDPEEPRSVAERLHAEFALAGTADRIGNRFRATVRLIDVRSGVLIWAERFEWPVHEGRFSGHDDIVTRIVTRVGDIYGVLTATAWSYSANHGAGQLTAFAAVLSCLQYQCRLDRESFPQVLRTIEHAVLDKPDFAWGWAALATLHLHLMCSIAAGGSPDEPAQALAYIKRALKIEPLCGYAHFLLGIHYLFCEHAEEAAECAERALEFAQGAPFETGAAGMLLSLAGEHERGQRLAHEAWHINPRLPGWIHWGSAVASFGDGDIEAAVAATRRFTLPDCFWDPLLCVAILWEAGDQSQARSALELACHLQPELYRQPRELIGMLVARPAVRERFLDNLQAAGLRVNDSKKTAASATKTNGISANRRSETR